MLARLSAALLLSLAACAAHEGPTPTPTPTPTPEPRAEVQVAIASVQLAQDCPDPATDAAATPATPAKTDQAYAPPPPAAAAHEIAPPQMQVASRAAPGAALPGGGGWSPPCVQSTMQLSLANTGDRGGKLEIRAVRLLDAQSKRALGPMTSRKPSEWNAEGTYRPWNQEVAPRSTAKAAYRLGEPDWGRVQSDLGATVDLYARPFILEVELAVDGRTQTLRSPEVLREQIHMIVT